MCVLMSSDFQNCEFTGQKCDAENVILFGLMNANTQYRFELLNSIVHFANKKILNAKEYYQTAVSNVRIYECERWDKADRLIKTFSEYFRLRRFS